MFVWCLHRLCMTSSAKRHFCPNMQYPICLEQTIYYPELKKHRTSRAWRRWVKPMSTYDLDSSRAITLSLGRNEAFEILTTLADSLGDVLRYIPKHQAILLTPLLLLRRQAIRVPPDRGVGEEYSQMGSESDAQSSVGCGQGPSCGRRVY